MRRKEVMFGKKSSPTALEVLVLDQRKEIEELRKVVANQQTWMFKLASKAGYKFKNNSWVNK